MLRIVIKGGNIDKGLKELSSKVRKTKQNKELSDAKAYVKPSVVSRQKKLKAKYLQQKIG
jgi:ribosomal protein S21